MARAAGREPRGRHRDGARAARRAERRGGEDPGPPGRRGGPLRRSGSRVRELRRRGPGRDEGGTRGPAAHPAADHRPRGRARSRRRGVGRAYGPRRVPRVDRHRRREHLRDAGDAHRRRGEDPRLQHVPAGPGHPDAAARPVVEPVLAAARRGPPVPVRRGGARRRGERRQEPPDSRRDAVGGEADVRRRGARPGALERGEAGAAGRRDGRGAAGGARAVAAPSRASA